MASFVLIVSCLKMIQLITEQKVFFIFFKDYMQLLYKGIVIWLEH